MLKFRHQGSLHTYLCDGPIVNTSVSQSNFILLLKGIEYEHEYSDVEFGKSHDPDFLHLFTDQFLPTVYTPSLTRFQVSMYSQITFCSTDIEECYVRTDDCEPNAECTNTVGSFTCHCKEGFIGNGTNCTGMYEQLLDTHDRNL